MFARTGVSPILPVHSMRVPRSWLVPSAIGSGVRAEAVSAPSPTRAEVATTARAPVRSWVRMSVSLSGGCGSNTLDTPGWSGRLHARPKNLLLSLGHAGHVEVGDPQRGRRGA